MMQSAFDAFFLLLLFLLQVFHRFLLSGMRFVNGACKKDGGWRRRPTTARISYDGDHNHRRLIKERGRKMVMQDGVVERLVAISTIESFSTAERQI
jgi:hypothetical protein